MAPRQQIPQLLDSKSECPPLFDGTTRLYYFPASPASQCVQIALNYKGLDEIERVPINIFDKPPWYKEKVYHVGKVPALEHNGKVKGESLDLLVYLDQEFGGPTITPTEEEKKEATAELLKYRDSFFAAWTKALGFNNGAPATVTDVAPMLDHLENVLKKYANEGPFFFGESVSMVDMIYIPFLERAEISFPSNYDSRVGRPHLAKWIQAMNTIDAYTSTKLENTGSMDHWWAVMRLAKK
jgi:glutathione S-transferase